MCRRAPPPSTSDTKLPRLHRILQLLFNWEDYHLHEFRVDGCSYGIPDPDDTPGAPEMPSRKS